MNRIRKEYISKSAALNLIITSLLLYSSLVLLANRKANSQWIPQKNIPLSFKQFLRSLTYQHCMVKITRKYFHILSLKYKLHSVVGLLQGCLQIAV